MKLRFVIPMLLGAFTAFISCSKDNEGSGPEKSDQNQNPHDTVHLGAPYFIGMVLVNGDRDTTLFKYDVNKRLTNIVDTYVGESMTGTYNSSGNLSQVVINDDNGNSFTVSYTYNESNQLIRIGRGSEYGEFVDTIIYVNGTLAKKSIYSIDLPHKGKPINRGYETYEVTDGNITHVMSYDSGGNLIADGTMTYNGDLNVFKSLAFYCTSGNLNVADIASDVAMFNKNMIASSNTVTNAQAHLASTYEYTYDDKKQLIMSVLSGTFNGSPNQNTTRTFFY